MTHSDRPGEDLVLRVLAGAFYASVWGLPLLITDEGYFIKYLDPDGTRHGVYGAEQHGYFETAPNHDAVCMRVVDDAQAKKIIDKMVSIDELAPYRPARFSQ